MAPVLNFSGYGEEARGFVSALASSGWPVKVRSSGETSPELVAGLAGTPELARRLKEALERPPEAPVTAVLHVPGGVLRPVPGAACTVGRTMYETDGLPPSWVAACNTLDEVWVPGEFNLQTFKRAGVSAPLHVVPGGVDAALFSPRARPLPLLGARGTVFLSIFEWSYRKGYDVLLRGWAEAFRPDDDVTLALRTFPRMGWDGDPTAAVNAMVDEELATFGATRSDVAPIIVVDRSLSPSEVPRLMTAADVYVSPSRGEGWGRPYLEAMACGLPVIGTRWSGNLEFMDDSNSLLIDVEAIVPVDSRMDVDHYRGQRWAEPSREHLVALLREAASNSRMRRELGARARSAVEQRWQWSTVARVAARRLAQLTGRTASSSEPRQPAPRVRWVGDVYADHSLAVVNRELCSRLAANPELGLEVATAETGPRPNRNATHLALVPGAGAERGEGPVSVEVRHGWPPDLTPPAEGAWVMIQPWEFGGMPAEWAPTMREEVDEIWVPTSWVKECYLRSGVPEDQVVVVPNGVDTATFRSDGERFPLRNKKSMRLLFVGGTIPRKGADLLLDAYLACFGPHDDVCLVVKPFGSDSVYAGSSLEQRFLRAAADPGLPAIEIVDGTLSREEMAALYRACQVLVHPYRGEGFALPVAEAMACGVPAIVTGYGACLDYCDHQTSWLLPAQEVPLAMTGFTPGPAGFWWAEPDAAALKETLRHVAGRPPEIATKAAAGSRRALETLSWERAAEAAGKRLVHLAGLGTPRRLRRRQPAAGIKMEDTMTLTESAMRTGAGAAAGPALQSPAEEAPALAALQAKLHALVGLTANALNEMKGALDQLTQRVAQLEAVAPPWPGVPPSLLTNDASGAQVIGYRDAGPGTEAGYVAFEDVFRGSEEEIRRRQEIYLPYFEQRAPVLDAGCGRGEMLSLLAERSISCRGADSDPDMVARCQAKGLDVSETDVISALAVTPDGSLGGVFSAQVIEHLPYEVLLSMLTHCRRALRPGGVAVLETVNPHCPRAAKNFWMDLTHQHPIFPEVALVLCRNAGFARAEIVFPGGSGNIGSDIVSCPDYAVVAYR